MLKLPEIVGKDVKVILLPIVLMIGFIVSVNNVFAQSNQETDLIRQNYLVAQKKLSRAFTTDFYPKFSTYYSLSEKDFASKIESARTDFNNLLKEYNGKFDAKFIESEQIGIKYYFDKLILDYPSNHYTYVGKKISLPSETSRRLQKNLTDFNRPELLANSDFTAYVKTFLDYQVDSEIKKSAYKNQDNQRLQAIWRLIPTFFTNQEMLDFWRNDYLYNHIDNLGIKNIDKIYENFKAVCRNPVYLSKVENLYREDWQGRQGHLTKTYKSIGNINLDIHLFLPPKASAANQRKPAIVFFHGGSWSEGKPDYFFEECRRYAQKGWVAAAVEYRLYAREGTLPFEAVMDAKSAIRWMRKNADAFGIDPEKIIASGNSAGGHLVLTTVLAEKWNEKTDDLKYSSIPNVLLVNAGVYDLTDEKTAWIRRDLKNKKLVREISPIYLIKRKMPPTLLIHGTADGNSPYSAAEKFKSEADQLGIKNIKFYPLEGAQHFIWFDPKYSKQVSKEREDFLKGLGF